MPKRYLLLFVLAASLNSLAQPLYFPPTGSAAWDTLAPERLGYCPSRIDSLYRYLDANNSKAFILLQDGKIVLEKYFNGHDAGKAWQWASAGKTIMAFLTGIAQQEGSLSILDSSSNYLGQGWTSLPPTKEGAITIRHQLTMTTGLDDGVQNSDCTLDTCLKYKADAGSRWAYHNAPYTLLGSVIESATGQSLNSYTTQKLKTPTGMIGSFVPVGDNTVFFSTARSFARFGLLMLSRGSWNGTPVLRDTAYFRQMISSSQNINPSYGYLWWLNGKSTYMIAQSQRVFNGPINPSAPADAYMAMGKDGQFLNVVPSRNLVWIRMGEAPDDLPVPYLMNDRIWEYLNALNCAPAAVSSATTKAAFRLTPNPAREFVDVHSAKGGLLQVYDMQGRILRTVEISDVPVRLALNDLSPGIYMLALRLRSGSVIMQLLTRQ